MKKIIPILFLAFSMLSCSTDDDLANTEYEFAEITASEFPDFFEAGKSYDLKLTFRRPSTCHAFIGIDGGREDPNSNEIFIYAITSIQSNLTNCDSSTDANLTSEGTIRNFMVSSNIDDEELIFKLWRGEEANGDPIYTTVIVPVGEPEVTE